MKLGISTVAYEMEEHFDKVIAPWQTLKNSNKIGLEIVSAISVGCFPESFQAGYPVHSRDSTEELLKQDTFYDNKVVHDVPMYEKDQRNVTLEYLLKQDIDYLILLDVDEEYSTSQITKILEFVKETGADYYRIEFKNYILHKSQKYWYRGFNPPRIWNNRINQGIKEYYWDNDIVWNNGVRQDQAICISMPEETAFIEHYSWWSKDYSVVERKHRFQTLHYPKTSFKLDSDGVSFDEEYYKLYNKPIPVLNKD